MLLVSRSSTSFIPVQPARIYCATRPPQKVKDFNQVLDSLPSLKSDAFYLSWRSRFVRPMNANVRIAWQNAAKDSATIPEFDRLVANQDPANPVAKGYQAMAYALRARQSPFPFQQILLFSQASSLIAAAIREQPLDVELRFLRFCMEKEIPEMIGGFLHIEEDIKVMIGQMPHANLPAALIRGICLELLDYKKLPTEHEPLLRSWLPFLEHQVAAEQP